MICSTCVRVHQHGATGNVWPAPLQVVTVSGVSSLHKRIRHIGMRAAAKMEIRASHSS